RRRLERGTSPTRATGAADGWTRSSRRGTAPSRGCARGRARDWGDQAGLRLPEGALPRTREEPAPARSQRRAGESVHDAATIAECVGAVSLKDEKCGDRQRKTPNRRAERIASLSVTRNR